MGRQEDAQNVQRTRKKTAEQSKRRNWVEGRFRHRNKNKGCRIESEMMKERYLGPSLRDEGGHQKMAHGELSERRKRKTDGVGRKHGNC